MLRLGAIGFLVMPLLATAVACSGDDSQSPVGNDSDSGASEVDGGSSIRSDGGSKTTNDAGPKTHDGGAPKSDAGSIGGGWTTEPFDNSEGLVIASIAAHPTAARNLLFGFEPGFAATRLAEWIDGTIGASLNGASDETGSPVSYVGDGSAYAVDFSNGGGYTLYHLANGASGRAFSGTSFGTGGARPPQVPFGPWPPRGFVGASSSARFLGFANQTLIDFSSAAQWPETDLPFANTAETAVMIDWLAFDPTSDTHALVGIHPETIENTTTTSSVRSCTITSPFPNTGNVTCDAVVADQGLPSTETQIGGWYVRSSPTHVYVETNTSAEAPMLYRSDDGGAHFSAVSVPSLGGVRGFLIVDPVDYKTAIFCGGGEGIAGQVFVTKDAAATWTSVTVPQDDTFACGAFDAAGTYFAGYGSTLVSQKF